MEVPSSGGNRRADAAAAESHNEMKFRDIIKQIEADGWYLVRTRGSHSIYKHPLKPGTVTVAGKASEEVKPKTLSSIRRQADL